MKIDNWKLKINRHIPVLLGETIEMLQIKKGSVVVDATLGSGGHTVELAKRVGKNGKVVSIDVDKKAIEQTKKRLRSEHPDLFSRIVFVNDNFSSLEKILEKLGIPRVHSVVADFGWRIEQIEDEKYGMSFRKESKLNMRLDQRVNVLTAHEIINNWNVRQLEEIFRKYGEERSARQIAKAIVETRRDGEIDTTTELAKIIELKYKQKHRLHAATKVFQALRIVVNDELNNLERFLEQSLSKLEKGGRIAVISFHSLEDRIVKKFFQTNARGCVCPKEFPLCVCGKKRILEIVTKKPLMATETEIKKNPRSRSARLRVAQKVL